MLRITDIQDNFVDWGIVPFVEIDDKIAENYLLFDNDIVFARTGATVGKSFLIKNLKDKSVYASYLIRIQLKEKLNAQFVKYFFESGYYWEQIEDKSVGTGQPNVNGTLLGELQIPIPPLSEQHRIVSVIESAFTLIDQIEENKLSLSQFIKQAKSKVLDLAIRGKLIPQNPNDEPTSVLLEKIRNERNTKNSASDILHYPFEVPEGWRWCRFSDLYILLSGRDLENSEFNDKNIGVPYIIGASNFSDGKLNIIRWTNSPKVISIKNDLLLTCKGTVGELTINDMCEVHIARQIMVIRAITTICTKYTKYCFDFFINSIRENAKGIIPGISRKDILDLLIPLPPLSEQKRIVSKIEQIFYQLDEIEKSINEI